MKVLVFDIDGDGVGLDIALRAQDSGHTVRYWLPPKGPPTGQGMIDKVEDWKPSMEWAELVILTGNSKYGQQLEPFFEQGLPIIGANQASAELELDRALGQKVLEQHGIEVAPYYTVDDIDEAIELILDTQEAYAIKPWGGESDKSMTCVAGDANEALFMLELWKKKGMKGKLMLQKKVEGVEMGIAAWHGPGGFCQYVEESFEHKKFMNDDKGCNTGEMGTVIRHVTTSKLFDAVLRPLADYLGKIKYVGDCSVNCIIDDRGTPWPLEFTMRLGWPDFCIRQAVIGGDPVEWLADLVHGKDTFTPTEQIALGVLIAHGDFPNGKDPPGTWCGYPVSGVNVRTYRNVHLQQVMEGRSPKIRDGGIRPVKSLVTAGSYVMICTGTGDSVSEAAKQAYRVADEIKIPSNVMYRTDIGKRLEKDLPALQLLGYAVGMKY